MTDRVSPREGRRGVEGTPKQGGSAWVGEHNRDRPGVRRRILLGPTCNVDGTVVSRKGRKGSTCDSRPLRVS